VSAARPAPAPVIDSQSVKTTEAGGPRGYDAGKKVNGRKRHALVDTDGRGLVLQVHQAAVQDRDGAIGECQGSCRLHLVMIPIMTMPLCLRHRCLELRTSDW
jgi:hypothetical protein